MRVISYEGAKLKTRGAKHLYLGPKGGGDDFWRASKRDCSITSKHHKSGKFLYEVYIIIKIIIIYTMFKWRMCVCMLLHRQALYDYEREKNVLGAFKEPELMIEHVILRRGTCVHHRVIYFNQQRAIFPRWFFSLLKKNVLRDSHYTPRPLYNIIKYYVFRQFLTASTQNFNHVFLRLTVA